ncbi:hypothetical protein [Promicromonospora sp. NPDC050262]|uniref:hypothetical protein n=1 Tax=Promicromonospora sp. NPDC050262 TaxID=3155036 RepID=UPI0033CBA9EA
MIIEDQTIAVAFGIIFIAAGVALSLWNRPITRLMLKGQFRDPAAPTSQWFYAFVKVVGWFLIVHGVAVPLLVLAGALSGPDVVIAWPLGQQ